MHTKKNDIYDILLSFTNILPVVFLHHNYSFKITAIFLLITSLLIAQNLKGETIDAHLHIKKVVILSGNFSGLPVPRTIIDNSVDELVHQGINRSDIFVDYLDLQRNTSVDYRDSLADLLQKKYKDKQISLIITIARKPYSLLLDEWADFLQECPY